MASFDETLNRKRLTLARAPMYHCERYRIRDKSVNASKGTLFRGETRYRPTFHNTFFLFSLSLSFTFPFFSHSMSRKLSWSGREKFIDFYQRSPHRRCSFPLHWWPMKINVERIKEKGAGPVFDRRLN